MSNEVLHYTQTLSAHDRIYLEKHFDIGFYLSEYPEIRALEIDPIMHFHAFGWRAGKNPSRTFDTVYYLRRYSDVADAKINPLLHYATAGQTEGRSATRRLDVWRRRLERLLDPQAPDFRVLHGDKFESTQLLEILKSKIIGHVLTISISHDDYAENCGGVQNMIFDEQKVSADLGWHYLHISPVLNRMRLADEMPAHVFEAALRFDYDRLCIATMDSVIDAVEELHRSGLIVEVIVHHLMGHSPSLIASLIRASGSARPIVWAHDFFTTCPSYTLLRNDVVFCGGPPPTSSSCLICHYGGERHDHLTRIRNFFTEINPVVMAPSQTALDNWIKTSDLPTSEAFAMPLARLVLGTSSKRRAAGTSDNPIRVAHVGARAFHKGWPIFENLALSLRDDRRYQFYQLGRADNQPIPGCIEHVPVTVTRLSRQAMIQSIAQNNIDIAIIWPFWPETYCFAAYEALAGGAFIVTHVGAGNVPKMIEENGPSQGCVLKNCEDLLSLFRNNRLIHAVANSRRTRAAIIPAGNSIGWLHKAMATSGSETHSDRAVREEAVKFV